MLKQLAARTALGLYGLAGRAATPLVKGHLRQRARRGREDPARLGERLGYPGRARPAGPLVWLHGASLGEALSALPLIEWLAAAHPEVTRMVTTGTLTSARVLAERLPAGVIHQFAPLDLPAAVDRFLAHWRPDLGLVIEQELWPNLVTRASRAGVRLVLLNGRMSPETYRSWRRFPLLMEHMLRCFSLVLAQSPEDQARLRALGASDPLYLGNLKRAAAPLGADPAELTRLRNLLRTRHRWLAASTHDGEEIIAAEVHDALAGSFPGLLTLIAPRHPQRGDDIARELARRGHSVARRAAGQAVPGGPGIYIADTVGELGLWYSLCEIVLVGGSLVAKGGQNPLEPARLDCAILYGPHVDNFARIVAEMRTKGALKPVADARQLAEAVAGLLGDGSARKAMCRAAEDYGRSESEVLEAVLQALGPVLGRVSGGPNTKGH